MDELTTVFLHTGSNLGDRIENLRRVNERIDLRIGNIIQKSGLYETEAWGVTDQPDYVNQALEVTTILNPLELLDCIFEIEHEMGRIRKTKWGSRVIDIDILFYGDAIIDLPNLTIPHPRIHKRNFVLVPLMDIAAERIHPKYGKTIAQLLIETKDECEVRPLSNEHQIFEVGTLDLLQ